MIVGLGLDVIEIKRIHKILKKKRHAFINKIAHPIDKKCAPKTKNIERLTQYWAARLASKEAFSKALGTGIGKTMAWDEVGVSKTKKGQPVLVFSKNLQKKLKKLGVETVHLTISHTKQLAVGMVVIEGKEKNS